MIKSPTTISIPPHHSTYLHGTGAGILIANKLRKLFEGYTDPRGFSATDLERAITYDASVVTSWEQHLTEYTGKTKPFEKKHVLELGPGADLGIGLLLLDRGAHRYTAFDKHNLIKKTPHALYEQLAASPHIMGSAASRANLLSEIDQALRGTSEKIVYRVDPTFAVQTITPIVDTIVSQAAFEHFDDVTKLAHDLSAITHSGSVLCAEIDLQTHSRYVREHDPLNIYRYSDWFYNLCAFTGSPNRLRPYEYVGAFEAAGWHKLRVITLQQSDAAYYNRTVPHLAPRFRDSKNDMQTLTCILLATKK
jgi:hypothetical protein